MRPAFTLCFPASPSSGCASLPDLDTTVSAPLTPIGQTIGTWLSNVRQHAANGELVPAPHDRIPYFLDVDGVEWSVEADEEHLDVEYEEESSSSTS